MNKTVTKEVATVERLKKDYLAKCKIMTDAVQLAAKGQTNNMTKKEYAKIQEKAIKAKKDVDQAEQEYRNSVKTYNDAQDAWENHLTRVAVESQKLDHDRLLLTKQVLIKVMDTQVQLLKDTQANVLTNMRQTIDLITPEEDINAWVEKAKTGDKKPTRLTFQSYFGEATKKSNLTRGNTISGSNEQLKIGTDVPALPGTQATAPVSPLSPVASRSALDRTKSFVERPVPQVPPPALPGALKPHHAAHAHPVRELGSFSSGKDVFKQTVQAVPTQPAAKVSPETSTNDIANNQTSANAAQPVTELARKLTVETSAPNTVVEHVRTEAVTASKPAESPDSGYKSSDASPMPANVSENSPAKTHVNSKDSLTASRTPVEQQQPQAQTAPIASNSAQPAKSMPLATIWKVKNKKVLDTSSESLDEIAAELQKIASVASVTATEQPKVDITATAESHDFVPEEDHNSGSQSKDYVAQPENKPTTSNQLKQHLGEKKTHLMSDESLFQKMARLRARSNDSLTEASKKDERKKESSEAVAAVNPAEQPVAPRVEEAAIVASPAEVTFQQTSPEAVVEAQTQAVVEPVEIKSEVPFQLAIVGSVELAVAVAGQIESAAASPVAETSPQSELAQESNPAPVQIEYILAPQVVEEKSPEQPIRTGVKAESVPSSPAQKSSEGVSLRARKPSADGELRSRPVSLVVEAAKQFEQQSALTSTSATSTSRSRTSSVDAVAVARTPPRNSSLSAVQATEKKQRLFSRRSIKMEGWLDICDDTTKQWVKRWCALEGGYIWFFEAPEDNNKANGTNKPKSMVSVSKCTVTPGNIVQSFAVPDVASKGPHLFTIFVGGKRQILMAAPDADDAASWIETLEQVNKKK